MKQQGSEYFQGSSAQNRLCIINILGVPRGHLAYKRIKYFGSDTLVANHRPFQSWVELYNDFTKRQTDELDCGVQNVTQVTDIKNREPTTQKQKK